MIGLENGWEGVWVPPLSRTILLAEIALGDGSWLAPQLTITWVGYHQAEGQALIFAFLPSRTSFARGGLARQISPTLLLDQLFGGHLFHKIGSAGAGYLPVLIGLPINSGPRDFFWGREFGGHPQIW